MIRKIELPYLMQSGGRWYFRRNGRVTRLPDIDAPDFLAKYDEAKRGRAKPTRTSVAALIESYMLSARFTRRAPRTRKDYSGVLDYLREKIGNRDVSFITRPSIIEAMEANSHRTRFANMISQVASILMEHAKDLGWVRSNEVKGMLKADVPEERRKPHVPWTDGAVAKARAGMEPRARLVLELGIGCVQRPADLTKFRWSDYDGDALTITQAKTGVRLQLPCTAALKAALDAAPKLGLTILTDKRGRPLTYRAMWDLVADERKRLGLMAYDLHALRYRGVMELAWAGCADDEIAAYSGHTSLAMIKKYAGEARQIMRARQARMKRK